MSKLDEIRAHLHAACRLDHVRDPVEIRHNERENIVPAAWYVDDVALLLAVADAALAYEEATQIPDGVQQAEWGLFSTLALLKKEYDIRSERGAT